MTGPGCEDGLLAGSCRPLVRKAGSSVGLQWLAGEVKPQPYAGAAEADSWDGLQSALVYFCPWVLINAYRFCNDLSLPIKLSK